mmetsp:Transcript_11145/g.23544  ORF Transcript_11145/g.23544 Transcript_11145/m.23544 type:complete len:264 (-) Transcript_11145:857-1648(-)
MVAIASTITETLPRPRKTPLSPLSIATLCLAIPCAATTTTSTKGFPALLLLLTLLPSPPPPRMVASGASMMTTITRWTATLLFALPLLLILLLLDSMVGIRHHRRCHCHWLLLTPPRFGRCRCRCRHYCYCYGSAGVVCRCCCFWWYYRFRFRFCCSANGGTRTLTRGCSGGRGRGTSKHSSPDGGAHSKHCTHGGCGCGGFVAAEVVVASENDKGTTGKRLRNNYDDKSDKQGRGQTEGPSATWRCCWPAYWGEWGAFVRST